MPYGFTYMEKKKIKDHYGDEIIIAEINKKYNVMTFITTASEILYDFHQQPESNSSMQEKMRVIEAAAKLVNSDIKSIAQSKDTYPTPSAQMAMDFLPESLRTLLLVLKQVPA